MNHPSSPYKVPRGSKKAPPPATAVVTLRDIAKKLGISHVAVSLALRDAPGVSETLRRQIQAMAGKMGYRPNLDAAALGRRRSSVLSPEAVTPIAWIDCQPEHRPSQKLAQYQKGARGAARRYGYVLEPFTVATNEALERLDRLLKAKKINGILLPTSPGFPKTEQSFPWQDYSVVCLSSPGPRSAFPSVVSDHFGNCLLALEKIRAQGYPRVGFVTSRTTERRFTAGFLTAQLNVPEPQRVPIHFLSSRTNTIIEQQKLDQWIREHRPDALLTNLAYLPPIVKGAGYRIPQDMGLASLDVLESDPTAGIDPRPEAIGSAAAEMLILRLNAGGLNASESSPETLVVGEWKPGVSLPRRPTALPAGRA